jgi:hypothetical protein
MEPQKLLVLSVRPRQLTAAKAALIVLSVKAVAWRTAVLVPARKLAANVPPPTIQALALLPLRAAASNLAFATSAG